MTVDGPVTQPAISHAFCPTAAGISSSLASKEQGTVFAARVTVIGDLHVENVF